MSIKVTSLVWQNSEHKGGDLLLLLAIADYAHDDGTNAYPTIETLARKTRLTQRAVQYGLRALESAGSIIIHYQDGPRGCNIYQVVMDFAPVQSLQGCTPESGGVQNNANGGAKQGGEGVNAGAPRTVIKRTVREPRDEPEDKSEIPQNPQDQENSELWPKWYALGYAIPGWKVSFEKAEAWRVEAGIPEQLADIKIYALREWWARLPKDGKRSTAGDPYMTWQNWCRQDRDKWITTNGGQGGNPTAEYNEEEAIARLRRDAEEDKAAWARAAAKREPVS